MNKKSLPFAIQIFYGIGVSYAIVDQIFNQWVLYYYLPPNNSGLKPLLAPLFISIAMAVSRLVDMIADPLVGWWSDKTKTRWGRRIPFIAIGSIPLAIAMIAYFYPIKSTGSIPTFIYLTIVGCLFFIFYTIVGAPYNALIPEISHTAGDRLNLSTWQAVFRMVYTAIAMIAPPLLIKSLGRGNTEQGIRLMVIILAVLAASGIYVTVFLVPERKYALEKKSLDKKVSLLKSGFKFGPLIFYFAGFLCFFFGFNILRTTMNYYVEDIMGMGKKEIFLASLLFFTGCVISFYPVNRLAKVTGYRKLMLAGLVMLFILSIMLFFLGKLFGPAMGFVIFFLMGIPVAGTAFIFPPAMLSDIASQVREVSGTNVGGILFGIQGFFLKTAFFLQIALVPGVLAAGSGPSFFDSLIKMPERIESGGIYATSLIAAGAFFVSFIFYFFYKEEKREQ